MPNPALNSRLDLCSSCDLSSKFFHPDSEMGFVRAVLAHGLRPAVCAGGDGGGRAGQSRLAGLATFGLILAAMVCARTCAMAFNRIVDRKFDALNPRTANRHLPTGQISLLERHCCFACCPAAGLVAASYFLNPLCFYLSPVALVVICFYSLTKRFTDYTHVFLGLALALAPVGAWLAVKGRGCFRCWKFFR